MASFSELYFSEIPAPPGEGELSDASPWLLSKYHVPLFWLALFEPKDLVDIPTEDGQGSTAYLVKGRTEALQMFKAREATIMARFPHAKPAWLEQFSALLHTTPFRYVHADTSDIGGMVGSAAAWRASLEKHAGHIHQPAHRARHRLSRQAPGQAGPRGAGRSSTRCWGRPTRAHQAASPGLLRRQRTRRTYGMGSRGLNLLPFLRRTRALMPLQCSKSAPGYLQ